MASKNLTTRTTIDNLAAVLKNTFGRKADLDALEIRVDGIASEGGEPNIIDTIQVNGSALEVLNKTVNIPVPTKVSELENDSEYATASEVAAQIAKIIDDAPESFDTLKEIADWIENHAESASAMNSEIKANAEDIDKLKTYIGELPEGTVATTVVGYIQELVGDIDFSEFLTADDISDYTVAEIEAMLAE